MVWNLTTTNNTIFNYFAEKYPRFPLEEDMSDRNTFKKEIHSRGRERSHSEDDRRQKRTRIDEQFVIGPSNAVTRLLITKFDLTKIIGKGGSIVSNIRNASGVVIKCVDITDEFKMVCVIDHGLFR